MKTKIVHKFYWLLILFVSISVISSSAIVTSFLLYRFNQETIEKDILHLKGLAAAVKGFIDFSFSINYQMSVHPEIVQQTIGAPGVWGDRLALYDDTIRSQYGGFPLLVAFQETYDFVELFFVQDIHGDQVARSYGPLGHRGDRWWFKQFTQNGNHKPFMSKSYFSMTGDKPVASALHPIMHKGACVGVMGTDINFEKLQEIIGVYLGLENLMAMVIDNDGVIIAHPDKNILKEMYNIRELNRNVLVKDDSGRTIQDKNGYHQTSKEDLNWDPLMSQILQMALAGQSGYANDVDIDGTDSRIIYEAIPLPGENNGNYVVVMVRDMSTIIQSQMAILLMVSSVALVTLAVLLLLFRYRFKRTILMPLERLIASMKGAESHTDISVDPNDELGIVVRTYNEMRKKLAHSHERLQEVNRELEQRVASKTKDLQETNENLVRDITSRKKIEQALRESEERYRRIIDGVPDSITINKIEDGQYLEVNNSFCRISGFRKEDALGRTPQDLNIFHNPEDRQHFIKILEETGAVDNFEIEYRRKSGDILNTLLSARKLKYKGHNALIAIVTDITPLGKAMGALRDSEEKYKLLVETASDAIFIYQNGEIKFPNRRAKEMGRSLGVSSEKNTIWDFIHPEDRQMVRERHLRRVKQRSRIPETYSIRLLTKQGKELWVEISAVYVNWEKEPAILLFIKDITQQKSLEVQFQHAQRMEGIGTLAGGIAHDFNNLLMGIQGNVTALFKRIDPQETNYQRVQRIQRCVLAAADLTRQLLGFARGGKYMVTPVNINEIARDGLHMFGRARKEIQIDENYSEPIWTIRVDRKQIEQVLLNIYINASQAMPTGGTIEIRTKNIHLTEQDVEAYALVPGEYVYVAITDNGTGMDEEVKAHIFEPFFTTKQMGRGTGLGLASAFGIIKNHDGFIQVKSQPGQGTTFTIFLPATPEHFPAVDTERATDITPTGTETVLIVDDDEMVVDATRSMLEDIGFEVFAITKGSEAIELFRRNYRSIAVVLLDMLMPDMDGKETCRRIREIAPEVPVILLSGYGREGDRDALFGEGFSGFLQKPFGEKELSMALREVLSDGSG